MKKFIVLILGLTVFMMACNSDEGSGESQAKIDNELIKDYLIDNNLTADSLQNGVYFIETVAGTGVHPTTAANITVRYTGKLLDGSVFDTTDGVDPRTFQLGAVIQGWQVGLQQMRIGSEATILIPSAAAYGSSSPSSAIPANSVLVFDVELINF